MTMFSVYDSAQKEFGKTCVKHGASEVYQSYRRADTKLVTAVKLMDTAQGKGADKMTEALNGFETALDVWSKKLITQETKEAKASLIKTALREFLRVIAVQTVSYGKDIKEMEEKPLPKATDKQKDVMSEAAQKGAAKNLKDALAYIDERRKDHLKTAEELMKTTKVGVTQAAKLVEGAQKLLDQIVSDVSKGQTGGTKQNIVQIVKLGGDATSIAQKLKEFHTSKLKDGFQKERNMGWGDVGPKYGLLDSQKSDFAKGQAKIAPIFTKATNIGKDILELIDQINIMSEEINNIGKQAMAAAAGGDQMKTFVLADITGSGHTCGGLIKTAIANYKVAVDELIAKAGKVQDGIDAFKDPTGKGKGIQDPLATMKSNVAIAEEAIGEAARKALSVDTTMKNALKKVPKPLLTDPTVVGAMKKFMNDRMGVQKTHKQRLEDLNENLKYIESK